jgi:hypothetical protein
MQPVAAGADMAAAAVMVAAAVVAAVVAVVALISAVAVMAEVVRISVVVISVAPVSAPRAVAAHISAVPAAAGHGLPEHAMAAAEPRSPTQRAVERPRFHAPLAAAVFAAIVRLRTTMPRAM